MVGLLSKTHVAYGHAFMVSPPILITPIGPWAYLDFSKATYSLYRKGIYFVQRYDAGNSILLNNSNL